MSAETHRQRVLSDGRRFIRCHAISSLEKQRNEVAVAGAKIENGTRSRQQVLDREHQRFAGLPREIEFNQPGLSNSIPEPLDQLRGPLQTLWREGAWRGDRSRLSSHAEHS